MKIKLYAANPQTWPKGRLNEVRLYAITESDLAAQQAVDDAVAMQDVSEAAGGLYLHPDLHSGLNIK